MKIAIAAIATATAIAVPVYAQEHQHQQMSGMAAMGADQPLKEVGQSAFAVIAEVTARLEADPATDWSKINIDALRNHLVDMDNVTLRSDVVSQPVPGGARFVVTSADPRVQASIGRMVRMHASMVGESDQKATVEDIANGVALTLTGADSRVAAQIRGLGFFGSLTQGVHHQRHHLAIAEGEMHH
ncbi:hypothetical protein [Sphingomonas sp.]|uniref:hypothetical protein n=1 Tax=Sphingomonas sp. TaxID=28214 RepID=UPI00286D5440|nr:hypothetical protein [Sphingomonas sp.]